MTTRRSLCLAFCIAACASLCGCFLFPNRPPTAVFVAHYNTNPEDPMVVVLDAAGSTDPDGDRVTRFMWAFSDNLALVQPADFSAVREVPRLVVRCPNEGEYLITLVVSDERGLSSEPARVTIVVPHPQPGPQTP